jgi:hypothetical protein
MNFTAAQQLHVRIMRKVLRAVQETPLVLKGARRCCCATGWTGFRKTWTLMRLRN